MGRPSNRPEKRKQIVLGFSRAMSQHGYAGTTIAKIAEEAKIPAGLVHYHFATKHEIAMEMAKQLVEVRDARFAERLARATTPLERLSAFIDAHVALDSKSDDNAVRAWGALGAEAQRDEALRDLYSAALRQTQRELQRLVGDCLQVSSSANKRKRAQIRTHSNASNRIARSILYALEGVFHVALAAPKVVPRGSASESVNHLAQALVASACI